jgi:hypothetical protein
MADFNTVNLAEIYGAADRDLANRQQMQYNQERIGRQRKQDAEDDAVKGAFAYTPDGLDEKTTLANLYRISPQKAIELQQSFTKRAAEASKMKREESSAKLGDAEKLYTVMGKAAAHVMSNPTLQNAITTTQQFGQLTGADITSEMQSLQAIGDNPEGIRKWAASHALTASEQLPKFQTQDTGGTSNILSLDPVTGKPTVVSSTAKTMTPGEIASNGIARANLGVAQGNLAVNQGRLAVEKSGGKPPAGYRVTPDGNLQAIPGGPGDKTLNPTESQGKAKLFSTRAKQADDVLATIKDYSPAAINLKNGVESLPLGLGAVGGYVANKSLSDSSQKAEQAQRNFVNAVLRQESGAAIGQSEFENAKRQYFPQPGDSAAVIKQKANNRKTAIDGLNTMAGPLGKSGSGGKVIDFNDLP